LLIFPIRRSYPGRNLVLKLGQHLVYVSPDVTGIARARRKAGIFTGLSGGVSDFKAATGKSEICDFRFEI
jgi:hypothetical protein